MPPEMPAEMPPETQPAPQRIMIIGSGGSGKSTLARQLGAALGLPVEHIDAHFWLPGWTPRDEAEFREIVEQIAARDVWVIDGNYSRTMDVRLARADTIIFLDFSRYLCTFRVLRRSWRHRGQTRPDMGPNCPERIDFAFLKWVWDYPKRSRPNVLQKLSQLRPDQRVFRLKSPAQVAAFLAKIPEPA